MDNQKKNNPKPVITRQSQLLDADRDPSTIIAFDEKQRYTLADFRRHILGLSQKLIQSQQTHWAVCCDNPYLFTVGLFALIYSHKTAVIPGHSRPSLLREQQEHFSALLTDLPLDIGCPTLTISSDDNFIIEEYFSLPDYPSNAQLILFTSGSTGKPKAIQKPLALLERESQLIANQWGQALKNTIIAATVSHQHLYGLTFRVLLPLALGVPFYNSMIEYHEQLLPLTNKYPTTLIASPAFLKRLDANITASSCQMIFSAGGPLNYAQAGQANQCLGQQPTEIYGTSETGVIAYRQQTLPEQLWQVIPPIKLNAVSAQQTTLDSPLLVDTPQLLEDKIAITSQGFHLLGRQDRIVKIEEKRISITDIEQRLESLSAIAQAAIIVLQQDQRQILAAVVVLSHTGQQLKQQQGERSLQRVLRQTLRQWIEPLAIPKRWRFINEIPINHQGKRAYIELKELFV